MSPRRQLLAGLLVGAIVGVAVGLVLRPGTAEDGVAVAAATTSTSTLRPVTVEAPWVEDGVRFRTTVLVPEAFIVDEDRAELDYALVDLGPGLVLEDEDDGRVPIDVTARPDQWELVLPSGVIEARTRPEATRVVFAVPSGTTRDDVTEIRVVRWRLPVALGSAVELDLEDEGSGGVFADGTAVAVDFVLDQASSKIVNVAIEPPDDDWHGAEALGFRADDARWRTASQDGHRIQLIWEGGDAPATLLLVADFPEWRSIDERVVVIEGGS